MGMGSVATASLEARTGQCVAPGAQMGARYVAALTAARDRSVKVAQQ